MAVVNVFIDVQKEGAWWVATDLLTGVADQGRSEGDAIQALENGLRERVGALSTLAARASGIRARDLEF